MMATASRTVVITVDTQRGTTSEARGVLNDVLATIREHDPVYASVGQVHVRVVKVNKR
jgi:hypothetical protein